ncbi:MAG: hypothetical protein JNJ85_14475, partial [Candidatus Kapabacteria bacterium]|nr:hypothetical protein [Candidatus Kapabacteria bacterium]
MKLFRTLFLTTLACVFLFQAGNAQHQRMVLVEEFTSQTCPPCVTAKPIIKAFANTPNVITVTYHQNYPAPGDVYNVLDNNLNRKRHDWYGVTGIPNARLNGQNVSIGLAALQAAAAPYLSEQSPLLITITEDRSKAPVEVTVTVRNDGSSAVSGVYLHTQVINYYADLKDYPDVKNNANTRYSDFDYCIMKAMPTIDGAPISIDAGKEVSVKYTYSMGTNKSLWTSPYVIAFIQNMNTKEVLQAGSNFSSISNQVSIESTESAYLMTGRNKDVKKTITLKNDKSKAMTVSVDFAGTPAVPADWTAPELSKKSVTIPPNGTATVDVTFKA